jgi:hypothetical protein
MQAEDGVNLSQTIKEVHQAVVDADIPPQMHNVAFAEALRYALNGTSGTSGTSHPGLPPTSRRNVNEGGKDAASGAARLAAKVGVDEFSLADIFAIDDDVTLHVASSKIDSVKTKATREIAMLIAAARQGSGVDEAWTAASHVRDALQQYNRFDPANFAAYLRKTGDIFNFRGKGAAVEVRLTKPGWEAAGSLIRSIAGGN